MTACEPTESVNYTALGLASSKTASALVVLLASGLPDLEERLAWQDAQAFLASVLLSLEPFDPRTLATPRQMIGDQEDEPEVFWRVAALWLGTRRIKPPDNIGEWREVVSKIKVPVDYLNGERSDKPGDDELTLARDFFRQVVKLCLGRESRLSCQPINDD